MRPSLAVGRGLLRRCPRCGAGRLFRRWFRMVERCPRCDWAFAGADGFFLGAFVVNLAVTELALGVFIAAAIALTLPDPPAVTLAALAGVVTVVVPVLFYPFSKTLWAAAEVVMKQGRSR